MFIWKNYTSGAIGWSKDLELLCDGQRDRRRDSARQHSWRRFSVYIGLHIGQYKAGILFELSLFDMVVTCHVAAVVDYTRGILPE